jgi:hypothetical protein
MQQVQSAGLGEGMEQSFQVIQLDLPVYAANDVHCDLAANPTTVVVSN